MAYKANPFKYEWARRWNQYLIKNANNDLSKMSFGELQVEAFSIFMQLIDEDVQANNVAEGKPPHEQV